MTKETLNQVTLLDQQLSDTDKQKELEAQRFNNPIVSLKVATATFIEKRFERLIKEENLEDIIMEQLISKIKTGEVKVDNLMTLLNQTRMRTTEAVESLLNFFKPVPNANEKSPFLDDISHSGRDTSQEIFDKASPEDLEALQTIILLLKNKKN